ncbi:hypothetical protein JX265_009096 [Neoarthrinium moseri]|uniref:Uncharacterized protein n=1 Tax=Neoarthrinium moseri TaxID=1658444 RepID=A0A9P9WHA7_9PEZI|nr:uncharacterized protein JN550_011481 [Neoarthrinium moseri]KAI1846600.1 hypothetical protein JX266_007173 [Neoarthrinium moseri]KAI1860633.1 hypothetical protein JN550_011481 [Neoarthrinium moseri]KAI1863050.1 hypothetical protein JX265_009096 [Neoarthrinium moseri]
MRSTVAAAFALLLPSLVAASAAQSECLQSKAKELAVRSQCGDKKFLLKCFQTASDLALENTVQDCLTRAGCTDKAAASEASYLLTLCDGKSDELRRREREEALAARNNVRAVDAVAAATTTTDSASIETGAGAGIAARQTTTAATSSSIGPCSTETITAVTSYYEGKNDYTVQTKTTSVCNAAYFCTRDNDGNDLCMVRQDGMTLSGSIVGIFLAIVLTAIIATVIFLCCRDRKEQKRIRARAEAAAIAKANAIESRRPEASQAARSMSQNNHGPSGGPNPFAG